MAVITLWVFPEWDKSICLASSRDAGFPKTAEFLNTKVSAAIIRTSFLPGFCFVKAIAAVFAFCRAVSVHNGSASFIWTDFSSKLEINVSNSRCKDFRIALRRGEADAKTMCVI